jgi:hypothetical protein
MNCERWRNFADCHLPEGLAEMQAAGCLAFTDDLNDTDADGNWHPVKAWLALDPTERNISARRLDGKPWRCIGDQKSRCLTGSGSKNWPLGITLVKPGDRLDVVEGDGDLVALWHWHVVQKVKNATPVGLMGSCVNLDTFGPEIAPYVGGRTVQIFAHRDASGTGQKAAEKWAESFRKPGAAKRYIRDLSTWLGATGKDLNDFVTAEGVRMRELTPTGLCPVCFHHKIVAPINGPTCACLQHVWPKFTEAQIASTTINT